MTGAEICDHVIALAGCSRDDALIDASGQAEPLKGMLEKCLSTCLHEDLAGESGASHAGLHDGRDAGSGRWQWLIDGWQ